MISNEQKHIAQWAMDFSLQNGCQACRVSIITASNNSFEYRNMQLDKLHQSSENKLYIELFVDNRYGTFSTNRLEKNELEQFIRDGIASTRFLEEDPFRQLPDSKRYYKNTGADLGLFDLSFENISTQQKLDLTRKAVEEIYGSDSKIISVSSSYDDGWGAEYMLVSNGFESETCDTGFSLTTEVALKTAGDARPEAYWYDSAIYWGDLKKTGIAKIALERALRKIGQQKIKSGKYTMLLDNIVSSRLLSPMFSAIYGSSLQQKNSFLLDRLGTQITSSQLTLRDCPHQHKAFGARWFDGEGVATYEQTIIDKGELKTYFIDTYNALKMDCQPTISSPSVICADLGTLNFEQLREGIHSGIWVTGFNGGNTNPTTGDFSFGVEGFLIEKGVLTTPISEMNITGNMLDLWANLVAVGNDPRHNTSWKIPSLLFENINFSGL